MAELERAAANDEGRAREWIARALTAAPDPAWTAEGVVSDRWRPVSPSGRLDGFEWRVPLRAIASAAPVIEARPAEAARAELPGERAETREPPLGKVAEEEKADATAAAAAAPAVTRPAGTSDQPSAAPVIPLVHAPDDPGPEANEETEPRAEPHAGTWRKMFE
jgi:HemY protein